MTSHELRAGDDQLSRALRSGADAVFVGRIGDGRTVVGELANETARLLFGFEPDEELGAVAARASGAARSILQSMRRAASRTRATRETLVLPTATGGRMAIELQVEPIAPASDGAARVLAVVRASDPALEPVGASTAALSVGVLRYEHGLGAVFVDEGLLGLLGLAHERALGQGWLDAVHADDRERVATAFATDRRPTVIDAEFRLAEESAPGGAERWARLRAAPLRGDDGAVPGYLATIEDVTEQRVAARSAQQLVELANRLDDWIGLADAEGRLVYANQATRDGLEVDAEGVGAARIDAASLHPEWTGPILLHGAGGRRVEIAGTIRAHVGADGAVDHYSFLGRDDDDARFAAHELVRLRRAVESTTDFVTFHTRSGRVLFANAAARAAIGLEAEAPLPEVAIRDFFEATPEQVDQIREALAANDRWSGELDVRGVERRIPASVVITSHRDSGGRYEYFSAVARDISERRKTDAARRRSEDALRSIVQSSPLAIYAVDAAATVHVWNRACEDLFGWSAAEAIGSSPRFASIDDIKSLTSRAFDGETVRAIEARYTDRNGDPIDAHVSVAPLRNAAGRVVSAVVVVADVTDQRYAEAALRESEVRFRSLVQNSSDMVTIVDDGQVLYRSPSAWRFLGIDPDGDPDVDVPLDAGLHEEDRSAVAAAFERLRANPGSSETMRYRFERGDGELRWIEMTATDHRDDPAVRGIVTNARDITDRVAAEESMRASEARLQSLLANISDVVSVVDAEGTLRYTSPSTERVYGYPAGHWPADRSVFEAVHPDDRDRVVDLWMGSVARPGEFRPMDLRLQKGDGSWMYAEVVANNLLDDPAVNGIVVTSRDVTERHQAEEALRASELRLRESEARYRGVVDDQTELVCRYRPDGTLTFANRAFKEFFGCDRDLDDIAFVDLRPAAARGQVLERMRSLTAEESVRTYVDREVALDGSLRWYQWTDRAFVDDEGRVVEIQSVGHDATDQRRAADFTTHQTAILEKVARGVPLPETLRAIAEALEHHSPSCSCAVLLVDEEAQVMRIGGAPTLAARVLEVLDGTPIAATGGSSGAAAFLRRPVYVRDVADDDRWIDHRDVAEEHGIHAAWSVPIVASDGGAVLGTLDAYCAEARLPDEEHQQVFFLLAQLASIAIERKTFEEQLAHQSMHDPLSELPNRLLFIDRLGQAIARCQRTKSNVAVLFLDLDRFKNINDSLGHEAGDELLVAVARTLESVIRPGDTVARFGGDEFAILCEDLHADTARELTVEIAQRLITNVMRPIIVRGTEMFVGASVGIAIATEGDERPEDVLRDADAAMNHAKESGRGRVEVFDDTMRARAVTVHATENALHRAIERGELRLFFQPVVSLTDARCVGAEALLRWQHPERGLIGPSEFIPLAEETGLVVPMGWWVVEEAARNAARWQLEQTEPFQVSVNLSARQLVQPGLADQFAHVIEESGVEPSTLCCEITESVLMVDTETVIDAIGRVRALGVEFAIDDFGTGYSSLGYLKRFPVDSVKIDRSFVSGLGTDPGDAAIVSAVIGLAHALDLRVTAEGVETEEQLLALIELGCDQAQGYFFSPPQPAPDLRGLVARTRTWRPPGATVMRPAGGARRRP
jgi:diguanylate cyclase (GGDEF)-like protein/PAS domain S-box-containing protein